MKKISTLFLKDPNNLGVVTKYVDPENSWVVEGKGIPTRKFDGTSTAIIDGELYKRYDLKPNKKKSTILKVGNIVSKKSRKPFKNGELTDEIIEICVNPQSPTNEMGARLRHSETIVNLCNLSIVGGWCLEDFKKVPDGAIPCQNPDIVTGHWPHWIKCDRNNKEDQYHFEAYDKLKAYYSQDFFSDRDDKNHIDGTYELCGEKINGNPENVKGYILVKHGSVILYIKDFSFDFLKEYLSNPELDIEGIVFHHIWDGRMCKLRKSDFGIKR